MKVDCRKKEKGRDQSISPYKVIEITPPPKSLGVRCLPHVSPKSLHLLFPFTSFSRENSRRKLNTLTQHSMNFFVKLIRFHRADFDGKKAVIFAESSVR